MALSHRTAPARAQSRSTRPARRRRGPTLSAGLAPILRRARQGKASLADIGRAAEELGLPVWVLLIPGLSTAGADIEHHAAAIERMVEDYLAEHCIAPVLRELHGCTGERALRGG